MAFEPEDPPISPRSWKPDPELIALAIRRCEWIKDLEAGDLEKVDDLDEWMRGLVREIVVSCYYQGLIDGVRHMVRKARRKKTDA